MELNENQKQAVEHFNGPAIVMSGAGSGKTKCIVERVISLISKGVRADNILCITFTNKAANEMKERITSRLGLNTCPLFVGTFHAFCLSILRKAGGRVGYTKEMSIMDDEDQKSFLIKVTRSLGYDKNADKIDMDAIKYSINNFRENGEDVSVMEEALAADARGLQIAKEYLKEIKSSNSIDFAGILYETVNILKNNADILDRLQERFKYIMIDEMQDTNAIQFQLINLMSEKYRNIMLIGDGSQSIYGLGSRYQNILDFMTIYQDHVKIPLGFNYRSTKNIVKSADKLIKVNKSHLPIDLLTDNEEGDPVGVLRFENPEKEAIAIALKIKELYNKGDKYEDMAIIYRINRLSMELQLALANQSIPYVVCGGMNWLDRGEIKDCLAMLKLYSNPKDTLAFHRVAGLFYGLGEATIGSLENIYKEKNIDLFQLFKEIEVYSDKLKVVELGKKLALAFSIPINDTNPGIILKTLCDRINYTEHVERAYPKDFVDRNGNIDEFINNATIFGQTKHSDIAKYLQNLELISSSDDKTEEAHVTLLSAHSSKGLEFKSVFTIGWEDGILPSMFVAKAEKPDEALEEERRIAYVLITRAKTNLFISHCKTRPFRQPNGMLSYRKCKPSQFLLEAGLLTQEQMHL